MNNIEALAYYQSRPKDAFMHCFVGDTSFETINETLYKGYRFYIPTNSRKKVKFLKKYFIYLEEKCDAPMDLRRRRNWCEFAETCVMMLNRIDSFFVRGHNFVAGSPKVCTVPWATFGKTQGWSQNKFEQIVDVSRHYVEFLHGKCYPIQLHFKNRPESLFRLSKKFKNFPLNNPNFWMGVAFNLTYDLIHHTAPDCQETFELFTNDYRIGVNQVSDEDYDELRMKILGIHPSPLKNLPRVRCEVFKPKKVKTEITMIADEIDDLALGEVTVPCKKPILCLPPAKGRKDEKFGPWPGPPYKLPIGIEDLNRLNRPPIPRDMMDLMLNPYLAMKHSRGMAGLASRITPITPDMI